MEEPSSKPILDLGRKTDLFNEAPQEVLTGLVRQAAEERFRLSRQKEAKKPRS